MTKVIYKPCEHCKKDTAHRVGYRGKKGRGKPLTLDYCIDCRKDYPNKHGRK